MVVPDEFAAGLDELDVIVVHRADDLGTPEDIEAAKSLLELDLLRLHERTSLVVGCPVNGRCHGRDTVLRAVGNQDGGREMAAGYGCRGKGDRGVKAALLRHTGLVEGLGGPDPEGDDDGGRRGD